MFTSWNFDAIHVVAYILASFSSNFPYCLSSLDVYTGTSYQRRSHFIVGSATVLIMACHCPYVGHLVLDLGARRLHNMCISCVRIHDRRMLRTADACVVPSLPHGLDQFPRKVIST